MDTSQICYHCATMGTPELPFYYRNLTRYPPPIDNLIYLRYCNILVEKKCTEVGGGEEGGNGEEINDIVNRVT